MKDDVELAISERAQVAHVGPEVVKFGPATSRETPHRRELSLRDVHERGRGAQLREQDRVPAAAPSQREDPLPLEIEPFERTVGDPIEKPPLSGSCPRRRSLRPRVGDTRLRKPLPHALVVRGHFVHCDALGHGEIVAA